MRFNLTNDVPIKPLDISIALTVLVYIFVCVRNKKFPNTTINKPVALFGVIGILSLLVNYSSFTPIQIFSSALYLVRWFAYLAIYFIIIEFDSEFKKKILKILFVDGLIILLAGFIQYFLYPNLRNLYYLGWDEHNYRMFSTFLDPNFAGAFFLLFLIFLLGLLRNELYICHSGKRGTSASRISKSFMISAESDSGQARMTIKGISLLFLLGINLTSIFLTYSRSAILMLISSSIVYLVLISKKKFIVILPIILLAAFFVLMPTFNKENTNLFRKTSSFARIDSYVNAVKIIKDHPFFGVGFNTYRYAQISYGFKSQNTKYQNHADAGVDNSFLFVWATMGIFGLGAYLYLWKKLIEKNYVLFLEKSNIFSLIFIAGAIGLFVDSFFINSLFYSPIMFWIWTLAGLAESD